MKKWLAFVTIVAVFGFAWLALPSLDQAQTTGSGRGIVQRIDMGEGMVTLEHGAVTALNMTAMTMAFPVKDKSQLLALRPMQQVDFQLSYDPVGGYLITDIR